MPVRLYFSAHQFHAVVPRDFGGAKKSGGALFGGEAFVLASAQRLDQFIELDLPLRGKIFVRFMETAHADQAPRQQITNFLADGSWSIPAVEWFIAFRFSGCFPITHRNRGPIAFHIGLEFIRRQHSRSEEHTSELQSHSDLVCRLLLEK